MTHLPRTPFKSRRGLLAWALYDWANSPFTTLIITFVFPAYFGRAIVGNEVEGQVLWGYAIGFSGFLIAIGAPLLGAIADAGGRRKPWLFAFTLVCASFSAALWFAMPNPAYIGMALICVIVANIGFEFCVVFNNAMLPDLVPRARVGRWSGWAWALGYAGGLAALIITLVGFVQAETPWLDLATEQAENVRIIGPLVAIWFAAFAWPLFVFTPDRATQGLSVGAAVRQGMTMLRATIVGLRDHANVVRFLLAHMLYADALIAIFAFGGIYAAGTFGMTIAEVIRFGILLNVAAGVGAFGFAWIDDWIGSRRTVLIALVGLIVGATMAVLVEDQTAFLGAGIVIGLFAVSGKATAFLGPTMVGLVTAASGSQRLGIASLLTFLVAGFILLIGVKEPR